MSPPAENAAQNNTTNTTTTEPVVKDTASQVNPVGTITTVAVQPPAVQTPAGNYKFIVEEAQRARALARFKRLTEIGVKNIQMETRDFVSFRLFFIIPAIPADTARICDSIRRVYNPAGRVYLE